jgi:hypothetical protein
VIIYQLFLILKKKANACILSKLFETIIWILYYTLNNDTIRMTIFDSKDNNI